MKVYIVVCPEDGPYVWNDDYANGCPAVVDYDGITCKHGWTRDRKPPPEAQEVHISSTKPADPA